MNILVIIPARGGSKGIPHKNVKELSKHSASCVFFSPLFLPTFVASL